MKIKNIMIMKTTHSCMFNGYKPEIIWQVRYEIENKEGGAEYFCPSLEHVLQSIMKDINS